MSLGKKSKEQQSKDNVQGKQRAKQPENSQVTYDILVEIGTEELPPLELTTLEKAFGDGVWEGLKQSGVINFRAGAEVHTYATPRRLAVQILSLHKKAEDKGVEIQEIKGPPIARAYDDSGIPTEAGAGFAKKQGIKKIPPLKSLVEFGDGKEPGRNGSLVRKGDYLIALKEAKQPDLQDVLPEVIRKALKNLPAKRIMRWGDGDEEWVRPVHWAVLLLDKREEDKLIKSKIVKTNILGVTTGNTTRGHRFIAPDEIELKDVQSYKKKLYEAKVIADFNSRSSDIVRKLLRTAIMSKDFPERNPIQMTSPIEVLLDEITSLVEWPTALEGEFDKKFLELPDVIIVAVMKHHQRYLPVYECIQWSDKPSLTSSFIFVANIEEQGSEEEKLSTNGKIVAGNKSVLHARLEDANFFFTQDRQRRLEEYRDDLKGIVFRQGLGTMYDKSERMEKLAAVLARELNIDPQIAACAARLAKADLAAGMVKEFPELQGEIGREYAKLDKVSEEVANAIAEHYRPKGRDDALPRSEYGAVLALADRLDTMAGFFGAGMKPSGSGDPFGLRRGALVILRLLIYRSWDLDLREWLRRAHNGYGELLPQGDSAEASVERALDFIMGRLIGLYQGQRISKDIFTVVDDLKIGRPLNMIKRVQAVQRFSLLPEAESLSIAYKRASNILSKQAEKVEIPQAVIQDLLSENTERELFSAIAVKRREIDPLLKQEKYIESLRSLASLKPLVDSFFDEVLVMSDNQALRNNRLALLQSLCRLFSDVAGIPSVDTEKAKLDRGFFEYDTDLQGTEDKLYYDIRDADNPQLLEAKNRCLDLWKRFERSAGSNFKSDLKNNFHAKFWEMYLSAILIDKGFQLVPRRDRALGEDKNEGPDILISENGQKIWVETTSSNPAEKREIAELNAKKGLPYGSEAIMTEEDILPIYEEIIKKKLGKYRGYVEQGIIKEDQSFIIAINEGRNYSTLYPHSIPEMVIRLLDKDYKGISGILFSVSDCFWQPKPFGDDFVFVHNHRASNPIAHRYFKIGVEFTGHMSGDVRYTESYDWSKLTSDDVRYPDGYDWRKTRT